MNELKEQFGDIDIYLFDQLLKGRFQSCKRVADLGCGKGRNLIYFLKNGHEVYGIDNNPDAICEVQSLAAGINTKTATEQFIVGNIDRYLPFENGSFDLVICNAVLHFAKDKTHFEEMLKAAWSLLKPGGYLFARLATDIGIKNLVMPLSDGRFLLPDGSERYLLSVEMIAEYNLELNATAYEPLKTTVVDNLRSMTSWCIQKN
jgi:SAM-dependent methyltransferase